MRAICLRQLATDWQKLPKAEPSAQHYFAPSGQAITHDPFWRYWSTYWLELGDRGVSERDYRIRITARLRLQLSSALEMVFDNERTTHDRRTSALPRR